jgi:hypothetical protein
MRIPELKVLSHPGEERVIKDWAQIKDAFT